MEEYEGVGGLVVAIALSGGSKSKAQMKWAIDKFVPQGKVSFKLLHVYPRVTAVPTPMGNLIPLHQIRDDIATAYKKEVEWQKMEMIVPFQTMCSAKKIPADIILLEADEIPKALSEEINKVGAKEIVIGASSNGLFSRKDKAQMLSSLISEGAPGFCTVYVISKGKLESLRPSDEPDANPVDDTTSVSGETVDTSSRYSSSTQGLSSSSSEYYFGSPSPTMKRLETAQRVRPSISESIRESIDLTYWKSKDLRDSKNAVTFNSGNHMTPRSMISPGSSSSTSYTAGSGSFASENRSTTSSPNLSFISGNHMMPRSMLSPGSSITSYPAGSGSFVSEYRSATSSPTQNSYQNSTKIDMELERLRMELRHVRGMYTLAQNETMDASRKLSDLNKLRQEEAINWNEINEKEARAKIYARMEKEHTESARREADYARERAVREVYNQRKEAELRAFRAAREKEKLKHTLAGPIRLYKKVAWEDIKAGCNSFAEDMKIGIGAYGTVYKCQLGHTTAAVKVLHSKEDSQSKQFQQELEVLSRIQHPHLLLLLGACPEMGCLVYEFMQNGSLEDRLFRKDNTPPLKWHDRFRIAWEVASALSFLHNTKPKPIIHRDLKPANILLDQSLVSKIGDAGLCTILNVDASSMTMASRTLYKETSPVGTLCYIDPEYQRTGQISTKADVYALGMVILQLLTAKPAVGIAHIVEDALEEGQLMQLMDPEAGNWPVKETTELAILAIQCSELRGKDRPDLKNKALPALERLKEFADQAGEITLNGPIAPPSHFICPILKDVMEDPCVAADGYTYDRKAIEMWLRENDTSPTTDFPLSSKILLPNFTLHYAVMEWKNKRKSSRNSLRSI